MAVRGLVMGIGAGVSLLCAGFVTPAAANPKYASLVIHAETGDVLRDRYSNAKRYPASLTKLMTLYLLFEELESGRLSLSDKLVVSKRASLQPASRLGLAKGSRIDVESAIEALIIRSANDVATVVAESLSGTESKFARTMTARARAMGMRNTTFRNASGLPDRRQLTTANDMAILAQRISQDFPQYFKYFDRTSFTWKGKRYSSHNKVARSYAGADGLKTGYTRASGYNLATTVKRGDHRLIGIVLGGRSAATRDAHMRAILDEAYRNIGKKPDLISAIFRHDRSPGLRPDRLEARQLFLASLPVPRLKPDVTMIPPVAPITDPSPPAQATSSLVATALPEATAVDPATLNLAMLEAALGDVAEPVGEGDAVGPDPRDWVIQVGAYRAQPLAIARLKELHDDVKTIAAGAGRQVNVAEVKERTIYRSRFTQLTETEANAACAALRENGHDCLALLLQK